MKETDTSSPLEFLGVLLGTLDSGYATEMIYRGEAECYPTVLPTGLRGETQRDDHLELGYFTETFLNSFGGEMTSSNGQGLVAEDAWEGKQDSKIRALAQHHGLRTSLLDMTTNPLVAAYFAVDYRYDQVEQDAKGPIRVIVVHEPLAHNVLTVPPGGNQRLHRQHGVFLQLSAWDRSEARCLLGLEGGSVNVVTLPRVYVDQLRLLLRRLGYAPSTMYGDLDSVAAESRWRAECEHRMLEEPDEDMGRDR